MFTTFDQAKQSVSEKGIEVIDLKFCDLWGRWHHLTIPASQFEQKLMEEGIGFDGSSIALQNLKSCERFERSQDFKETRINP